MLLLGKNELLSFVKMIPKMRIVASFAVFT